MRLMLFALVMMITPSLAADGAKFRAIGFSKDNAFFAFEQYGVQDGSGFPYADVFILDIAKDEWVNGTPVLTLVESETAGLADARSQAKVKAEAALKNVDISVDAEILATNFSMGILSTPDDQGTWTLTVSNTKVSSSRDCGEEVFGYKLELKNNKTGQRTVLHQDENIPKSRFCPLGYDLEAIVQPVEGDQLVAIIGVSQRGFEGADRRFIAVPFKFN
jgi:predicted secreted protein